MAGDAAGATRVLSEALVARARQGLPESVIVPAREVLLDAIGCLFAGVNETPSRIGREYAAATGGRPQSSVAGLAERVDAATAAFSNGITIHALDFEPIGSPPCHAPASVLPAVLALAESRGSSGRELLVAFALGWEVEARLRAAGTLRPSFHPLGVYGPVAAAAACAVLLRLDSVGIERAISIGASAAGGLAANGHTSVKVVHSGSAARAGVVAALQAEAGLSGAPGVLERSGGYGDAFFAEVDWSALDAIASDGRPALTADGVAYKPYPVQLPMLGVVDAVLDVRPAGFDPADVVSLELVVPSLVASRSNPRPASGHAGKFSTEFCAAVALAFGEVGIATFDDVVLSDPVVRGIIARIEIVERPELVLGELTARLRLRGGEVVEASRKGPRGSRLDPLSREQRIAKLRGCLAHGGVGPLAEELIACVERLETTHDVSELGTLLRAST